MIAKLGQDGHDRGAKVVATGYADIGFDVDMGPLFQTRPKPPNRPSKTTCMWWAYRRWPPATRRSFRRSSPNWRSLGREDIVVIVGGVIPHQDYDDLYKAGAAAIFGPGTPISTAAIKILEILNAE